MKFHYKDKAIVKNEFYNKGVKVVINAIREGETFGPEEFTENGGRKINKIKVINYQCEMPDSDLIWFNENDLEETK